MAIRIAIICAGAGILNAQVPSQQSSASAAQASAVSNWGDCQTAPPSRLCAPIPAIGGIEVSGGVRMMQPEPAQIEVFRGGDRETQLAVGYQSVRKEDDAVVATARVPAGEAAFCVDDCWKVSGTVLSLSRKVRVTSEESGAGFLSVNRLSTAPTVAWTDADYLVPGLLYGEPHTRDSAHGGASNLRAKHPSIREDYLSAPLIAQSFRDGTSATVMDLAPRGDTTHKETIKPASSPVIEERIQFGALGFRELSENGLEFGLWALGVEDAEAQGNDNRRRGK